MKPIECDCKERGLGSKLYKSSVWLCDHNRLSTLYPGIVRLWSPTNKFSADSVTAYSSRRWAILKCANQNCGHINEKVIGEIGRTGQFTCTQCRFEHDLRVRPDCDCEAKNIGVRTKDAWVCQHNNLMAACPNVRDFWRECNASNPLEILAESYTKCQLRCSYGHEQNIKANRLRQAGEYVCQSCKLLSNSAAEKCPHLINEVNDGTDLSKYLYGSTNVVTWKCSVSSCGHIWNTMIQTRTIEGHGCPKCAGNAPYTYETFIIKANEIHQNKYRYPIDIPNFNLHLKIPIVCLEEFHGTFLQVARHHIHSRGCPKCGQSSRGEAIIMEYLTSKGIKFNTQERFVSLKEVGNRRFKYDFYILNYNLVIEFDGMQHFIYTNWSKDNDKNCVKARMDKDILKEQFLLDNGISLVRIPYTNIENIPNYLDWLLSKLDPKHHNILTYSHYISQLKNTRGTFIAYTEVISPPIDWSSIHKTH